MNRSSIAVALLVGAGLTFGAFGLGQGGPPSTPPPGGHSHARPSVPAAAPAAPASVRSGAAPTYWGDVRPILESSCVGCHTEGGIAPFSLRGESNARRMARDVADATTARYMPPWMPGGQTPALQHDRRLSDAEIATLAAWAKAGAPAGDAARPAKVTAPALPNVRADLDLRAKVAYAPDPKLTDDYRCLVLDPALNEERFVTGYDINPDRSAQVHHVILFQVGPEGRAEALAKDGRDGRPGWTCFGGPGVGGSTGLPGVIGSWTPGTVPTAYPKGTGVRVPAGGLVVMQVHYNLAGGRAPDRTTARLQLAPQGAKLDPLSLLVSVAPVELPCLPGDTSKACERREALRQSVRDEGQNALTRTQGLLTYCGRSAEDYARQNPRRVTSTCDRPVRRDLTALGAILHMHTRGVSARLELNPGTPNARVLLDIPAWDFHWQGSYWYEEPIALKQGDTVRITCTWDNTRVTPPRYVVWGEGTGDEMCLGALSVR